MWRSITALMVALTLSAAGELRAGAVCEKPQDAMALRVAAMQQEMMVAALVCRNVAAYNDFVVSHQAALQDSDRVLLRFFETANPQTGFDDYNLYKTELANNASLRSMRDGGFCVRVGAGFIAAQHRSLEHALMALPYPLETGTVQCPPVETASVAPDVTVADSEAQDRQR